MLLRTYLVLEVYRMRRTVEANLVDKTDHMKALSFFGGLLLLALLQSGCTTCGKTAQMRKLLPLDSGALAGEPGWTVVLPGDKL